MALVPELLATKRQMEKSRQPRSQALVRTALFFRDSGGPSCSRWEGGTGTQAKGLREEDWAPLRVQETEVKLWGGRIIMGRAF